MEGGTSAAHTPLLLQLPIASTQANSSSLNSSSSVLRTFEICVPSARWAPAQRMHMRIPERGGSVNSPPCVCGQQGRVRVCGDRVEWEGSPYSRTTQELSREPHSAQQSLPGLHRIASHRRCCSRLEIARLGINSLEAAAEGPPTNLFVTCTPLEFSNLVACRAGSFAVDQWCHIFRSVIPVVANDLSSVASRCSSPTSIQ